MWYLGEEVWNIEPLCSDQGDPQILLVKLAGSWMPWPLRGQEEGDATFPKQVCGQGWQLM